MEPPPREAVPADVPSVGDEEWERLGRREIPDPDDEAIRQLCEDLALDPGSPFLRCEFTAALERIGQRDAAIGQLREVWRRLAEALTADATDVESVLAMAYAVEQAAIRQLFVDFLIHLPAGEHAAFAGACLVAIALNQANDPGGAIAVLQHALHHQPPPSPELEALARMVLAHSLRSRGDPEAGARESRLARELAEGSGRAELLCELQVEIENSPSILPRDLTGPGAAE